MQLGVLIGRHFRPLTEVVLTFMKNVQTLLTKSVLMPLALTTATSAADAEIHKKVLRSRTATLIISNQKLRDVMKVVKSLKDSAILIKRVTQSTKNITKKGCIF